MIRSLAFSTPPPPPSTPPSPQPTPATPLVPQNWKVIFATGGITNGQQALEVLDAGLSVAMVYTAVRDYTSFAMGVDGGLQG